MIGYKKHREEELKEAMNTKDVLGRIPLHYAAAFGDLYMVQNTSSGVKEIDTKSMEADTPKQKAIHFGNTDASNLLDKLAGKQNESKGPTAAQRMEDT